MSTLTNTVPAVSTWKIDPAHSVAEFKIKHMMISNVKGHFTGVSGSLSYNENDISRSSVEAAIEAATINTGDNQRDGHLKSGDFLDVEKFPALTFRSTSIENTAPGELKLRGDLTIHGVTRPVVFDVEGPTAPAKDPWGKTRVGVSATTRINRKDFGLAWNAPLEAGGILVGEEVTIMLDLQFVKD